MAGATCWYLSSEYVILLLGDLNTLTLNDITATFSLLGLMLSAYARVGAVLGDKDLVERAVKAGGFLKEHLWDDKQQTILRSCYRGDQMEVQQM